MKTLFTIILFLNLAMFSFTEEEIIVEEFVQEEKIKIEEDVLKKIPELNEEQKLELMINLCISFIDKYFKEESPILTEILSKFEEQNKLSEKIYYMSLNKCMKSVTFEESIRLLSKGKEYMEKNYKDYIKVNFTILETKDDLILNIQEIETKEMFDNFKQKYQEKKNKNEGKQKNNQNRDEYKDKDQGKKEENQEKSESQNNKNKYYENEGEINRNHSSSKSKNRKSKKESSFLYEIFSNTDFIIFISFCIAITILIIIASYCCCTKSEIKNNTGIKKTFSNKKD